STGVGGSETGAMGEQETHNFMKVSVDSFSELPFIRPGPARENASHTSPAIRLFGIDFATDPDASQDGPSVDPPSSTTETSNTPAAATTTTLTDSGESSRKFECHYCCRKFPTSQALGGHQNAHKRERQHAKRTHLHSAMASQHYHHHHHPSFIADGHVYGYLDYRHLSSFPSASRFDHPPPTHYPSWTSHTGQVTNPAARFYGGLGSASQLINGSPLPGPWRMPVHGSTAGLQGNHPPALPSFGGRDARKMAVEGAGGVGSSSSSSSSLASPNEQGGFDSGSKNSLSLDLHL
ncbi:unnamed protein product, partial [Musa banksii]